MKKKKRIEPLHTPLVEPPQIMRIKTLWSVGTFKKGCEPKTNREKIAWVLIAYYIRDTKEKCVDLLDQVFIRFIEETTGLQKKQLSKQLKKMWGAGLLERAFYIWPYIGGEQQTRGNQAYRYFVPGVPHEEIHSAYLHR